VDYCTTDGKGFLDELPQGIEPTMPQEAFQAAPILIPVYEDTRAEDLSWEEIAKWQATLYGKKRRSRGEEDYAMLLDIWDEIHDQHKSVLAGC
jgi:hypothetical protein